MTRNAELALRGLQRRVTRRQALVSGAGAVAAATLPRSAPAAAQDAGKVIVGVGGGAWEAAQDVAYFQPFMEETGIEVVKVPFPDLAKYRAMVETGNVELDISDVDGGTLLLMADQGILEPIDYSVFDQETLDNLLPEAKHEFGVGALYYSLLRSYRTEAYPDGGPATWAEFWDTGAFPGPRTLASGEIAAGGGTFEIALLADGVAPDDLYPLDFDRAFASLDKIRNDVVSWWVPGAQAPQLLSDGQVDLASAWNGRIQALLDEQVPVAMDWNEGILQFDLMFVPRGAPNPENAMKLLAFMSRAEPQAVFAQNIAYGPSNAKAYDFIPEERAAILPTSPELITKQIVQDYAFWNSTNDTGKTNVETAIERWATWVSG